MVGLVVHVVTSFAWAVVFVSLVTRGLRSWTAGAVTGIAELLVSWTVARATGEGLASVLAIGDRLVLAVVSVVSLIVALRLAVDRQQSAAHSRE